MNLSPYSQAQERRLLGVVVAVVCMALSGFLLWLAQKQIPMGTAYAVWTGMGAAGTFAIGIALYGDLFSWGRILGVALIVGGVATLKLAHRIAFQTDSTSP